MEVIHLGQQTGESWAPRPACTSTRGAEAWSEEAHGHDSFCSESSSGWAATGIALVFDVFLGSPKTRESFLVGKFIRHPSSEQAHGLEFPEPRSHLGHTPD